ncbi:hypothetical protein AYI68_g2808 [Smittium mucronatum]|uniref:Uncharacterized protein n=1 Tax=Smittium mucronatum TaxID=133383 RepID=A0A1R0H1Q3_9FUNG|nr:hypothetical protein AYI68_g2808 [Smittium mucronatum]
MRYIKLITGELRIENNLHLESVYLNSLQLASDIEYSQWSTSYNSATGGIIFIKNSNLKNADLSSLVAATKLIFIECGVTSITSNNLGYVKDLNLAKNKNLIFAHFTSLTECFGTFKVEDNSVYLSLMINKVKKIEIYDVNGATVFCSELKEVSSFTGYQTEISNSQFVFMPNTEIKINEMSIYGASMALNIPKTTEIKKLNIYYKDKNPCDLIKESIGSSISISCAEMERTTIIPKRQIFLPLISIYNSKFHSESIAKDVLYYKPIECTGKFTTSCKSMGYYDLCKRENFRSLNQECCDTRNDFVVHESNFDVEGSVHIEFSKLEYNVPTQNLHSHIVQVGERQLNLLEPDVNCGNTNNEFVCNKLNLVKIEDIIGLNFALEYIKTAKTPDDSNDKLDDPKKNEGSDINRGEFGSGKDISEKTVAKIQRLDGESEYELIMHQFTYSMHKKSIAPANKIKSMITLIIFFVSTVLMF